MHKSIYDDDDDNGSKRGSLPLQVQCNGEDKRETKYSCLYEYNVAPSLKQMFDKNVNETFGAKS